MSTPICTGPEFQMDRSGTLTARTPRKLVNPFGAGSMAQTNALMTDPQGGLWTPQTPLRGAMQQWQGWGGGPPVGGAQTIAPNSPWTAPITMAPLVNPSTIHTVFFHVKIEWELSIYTMFQTWVEMWAQFYWIDPGTGGARGLAPWAGPNGWYVIASQCPSAPAGNSSDHVYWHKIIPKTYEIQIPPGVSVTPSFQLQAVCITLPSGTAAPQVVKWRASVSSIGALMYPANVA